MERIAQAIQELVENGLKIKPVEMAIQIGATLVLVLVVKFFFWDKVTAFLEARREHMEKALTDAVAEKEEAKALREEAEKTFEQVKQDAKRLLEDAESRGDDTRRDIIAKAKEEAVNIRKNAQRDITNELDVARGKLRDEIIDIASRLAEKVIAEEIDKTTYDKLVDEAIEEVGKR